MTASWKFHNSHSNPHVGAVDARLDGIVAGVWNLSRLYLTPYAGMPDGIYERIIDTSFYTLRLRPIRACAYGRSLLGRPTHPPCTAPDGQRTRNRITRNRITGAPLAVLLSHGGDAARTHKSHHTTPAPIMTRATATIAPRVSRASSGFIVQRQGTSRCNQLMKGALSKRRKSNATSCRALQKFAVLISVSPAKRYATSKQPNGWPRKQAAAFVPLPISSAANRSHHRNLSRSLSTSGSDASNHSPPAAANRRHSTQKGMLPVSIVGRSAGLPITRTASINLKHREIAKTGCGETHHRRAASVPRKLKRCGFPTQQGERECKSSVETKRNY